MSETEANGSLPVDRPLTEEEFRLALWMLNNGDPAGKGFVDQLKEATVGGLCSCGCRSVDFSIGGRTRPHGSFHILGDFIFGSETNQNRGNAFIFEIDGTLAGLEICMIDEGVPDYLPKPSELRTWEDGYK